MAKRVKLKKKVKRVKLGEPKKIYTPAPGKRHPPVGRLPTGRPGSIWIHCFACGRPTDANALGGHKNSKCGCPEFKPKKKKMRRGTPAW